jgi:hypothetical protein
MGNTDSGCLAGGCCGDTFFIHVTVELIKTGQLPDMDKVQIDPLNG